MVSPRYFYFGSSTDPPVAKGRERARKRKRKRERARARAKNHRFWMPSLENIAPLRISNLLPAQYSSEGT